MWCRGGVANSGETWVEPRNLSNVLPRGVHNIVVGLGDALQLSSANKYHPNRMIWNGVGAQGNVTNRAIAWFSDDGGKTFELAKDAATGSIFLPVGIGEESALAESPDGSVFLSSRNFLYHGKGKCDCRASVRFATGGDTFGDYSHLPSWSSLSARQRCLVLLRTALRLCFTRTQGTAQTVKTNLHRTDGRVAQYVGASMVARRGKRALC